MRACIYILSILSYVIRYIRCVFIQTNAVENKKLIYY